ncbi:TPR-like protein [Hyaloscypha bicolor E]|uniref:TPR-like protein n=1 Tax=Hyaloscypha bicolor E TaxID=1095630 RepID=A0A2J6SRW6_9HELO|nr:TPR-like protein [Hyaloscypha bicolor E]PMD53502.1 TPR-like protein [Hyaloscypha bicolor E]
MYHQGQFAGAEQTFRHVIDDMDETKQDDLIASRYGLASSLIAQRKFTEAKSTLEEVPTIMSPIKNCRHTGEDLAACVHRLGVACWELNQYREARDCFQRVVDIVPETPNQNHSASQQCLAMALFELQEFESARKHFQERYDPVTKHFPSRRQFATVTRFWLVWSLCELGHFNEAKPHLQHTFTMFPEPEKGPIPESEFVLGRSHYSMGRIVLCQKDRKDPKEAAKHFRIALPMLNRRFGSDDQTIQRIFNYDEACEHLKPTVTAYEATYGYDNLQTSLARAYLVDSLCERKRYIEADPVLINVATQQGASPGTKEELVKAIGTYWLGRHTYDRAKWKETEDCFDTAWTLLAASSRDKTWNRLRFGCRHCLARIKLSYYSYFI